MAQPPSGGVLVNGAPSSDGLLSAVIDALEETARALAGDVEATEELAARFDPPRPGVNFAAAMLRRRAELVGIAHAYFKEMAEHAETPVVFTRTIYGVPGIEQAPPVIKL